MGIFGRDWKVSITEGIQSIFVKYGTIEKKKVEIHTKAYQKMLNLMVKSRFIVISFNSYALTKFWARKDLEKRVKAVFITFPLIVQELVSSLGKSTQFHKDAASILNWDWPWILTKYCTKSCNSKKSDSGCCYRRTLSQKVKMNIFKILFCYTIWIATSCEIRFLLVNIY